MKIDYSRTVSHNYQSKRFGLSIDLPDGVPYPEGLALIEFVVNFELTKQYTTKQRKQFSILYQKVFGQDLLEYLENRGGACVKKIVNLGGDPYYEVGWKDDDDF